MLPKWTNAWCCRAADPFVFWMPKGPSKDKRGKPIEPNPPKTGWVMATDDTWMVNVTYCPFCGMKLADLPPQEKK